MSESEFVLQFETFEQRNHLCRKQILQVDIRLDRPHLTVPTLKNNFILMHRARVDQKSRFNLRTNLKFLLVQIEWFQMARGFLEYVPQ